MSDTAFYLFIFGLPLIMIVICALLLNGEEGE